MAAAITTISETGYRNASFTQIAKRAGLSSTGLISYHFASRDDLIGEVVQTVLANLGEFMGQRMSAVTGRPAASALRAYIEGNVEFTATHRDQMKVLSDIFIGGGFGYGPDEEAQATSPLEAILRAGQDAGDFRRDFDPSIMAALVQRSIDGLPFLLDLRPGLDVAGYAREVVTAFDLATRGR